MEDSSKKSRFQNLKTPITSESDIQNLVGFTVKEKIGIGTLLLLIFISPLLLTQLPSLVDFTETGNIGDTIGGITAPFVNLLAAYLVYKSFTAQIRANSQQRIEHNKQIAHLNKEHGFNYITNLFTLLRDNYYANNRTSEAIPHLTSIYEMIIETDDYIKNPNKVGDNEDNFYGQSKESRIKTTNIKVRMKLSTVRNHLDNLILLIEEVNKLNLERGMRHFYKHEIDKILSDMHIHYILKDSYWEKIIKTDILHGDESLAMFNLCIGKLRFIIENKEKIKWPDKQIV